MKLRHIAIATSLLFGSSAAFAASQGTLGLTSTGTTDLSITKGETAQISGLDDIALGSWSTGDAAPTQADALCVYTSTGNYEITATSANATGTTFRLKDSGSNYINYTVDWTDDAAVPVTTALSSGVLLAGQVGDAANTDCGGVMNASVTVNIANGGAGGMNAAATGNYSDTLTLLVAPE